MSSADINHINFETLAKDLNFMSRCIEVNMKIWGVWEVDRIAHSCVGLGASFTNGPDGCARIKNCQAKPNMVIWCQSLVLPLIN